MAHSCSGTPDSSPPEPPSPDHRHREREREGGGRKLREGERGKLNTPLP